MASYNSLPEHIMRALFLSNGTKTLLIFTYFFFVEYQSWSSVILATIAILSVSTVTQWESPGLPASANFQHFFIIFESDFINNSSRKSLPIIGPFAATNGVQDKTNCKHKTNSGARAIHSGCVNFAKP